MNRKIPLAIFSFVFLILGAAACFWFVGNTLNSTNNPLPIKAVAQKSLSKEKLKTDLFLSLLDLQEGQDLKTYDLSLGEKRLKKFPLLKKIKLTKIFPHTLHIEYSLRTPHFLIQDCQNLACDEEGVLFPVQPFLTPKSLPKVFLGIEPVGAGKKIDAKAFILAKGLCSLISEFSDLYIKKIDVSKAYIAKYGDREIRISVEDKLFNGHKIFYFPFILRLSSNHFNKQLANFLNLRKAMLKDYEKQLKSAKVSHRFKERVIDLRIENLALIEVQ